MGRMSCLRDSIGGADRDRTDDPLLAKQMLSQLSYSPGRRSVEDRCGLSDEDWRSELVGAHSSFLSPVRVRSALVGLGRFELPTSRLSGVRSNQLSYRPLIASVSVVSDPASHLPQHSIVSERGPDGGSLKTEQEDKTVRRYSDSSRPRKCILRDLVLIRGGGCSLERR
jgi:hypothetical protein